MNRRKFLKLCAALAAPMGICGSTGVSAARPNPSFPNHLSEDALENMLIEIWRMTDERGLRLNLAPTLLYVTDEHVDDARKLLAREAWRVKHRHERILARGGYHTLPNYGYRLRSA